MWNKEWPKARLPLIETRCWFRDDPGHDINMQPTTQRSVTKNEVRIDGEKSSFYSTLS